jgi:hypothetical protein
MPESLLTASTYSIKFRGTGQVEEFEKWLPDSFLQRFSDLVWEIPSNLRHQPCRGKGCLGCLYHGVTRKLWFPCLCQKCGRSFVILANHLLADTRRCVETEGGAILVQYQCPAHQSKKHARWALMNREEFAGYLD